MTKTCSVEGCESSLKARGWCSTHYARWCAGMLADLIAIPGRLPKGVSPKPVLPRLMQRRRMEGGCWTYDGARNDHGYGQIKVNGKLQYAHRVAYELFVGPIPDGLELDHLCRNPACFRPSHLEAVTHRENALRGESPGAIATRTGRCMRGHELTDDNVWLSGGTHRQCRTCGSERNRQWYRVNRPPKKGVTS